MVTKRYRVPSELIEELAKFRHRQLQDWTKMLFLKLQEFDQSGKTLQEFGAELRTLCLHNFKRWDELPEIVKESNREWAKEVIIAYRRYSS